MRAFDLQRAGLGLALAAAPATAFADTTNWFTDLFKVQYPGAFDYIILVLALLVAPAAWLAYYRYRLPSAVLEMQRPDRVKWVAFGLSLAVFALLMMLAPGFPAGWLLIVLILGAVIAFAAGLSPLIGAVVLVLAIIIVGVKSAHIFTH